MNTLHVTNEQFHYSAVPTQSLSETTEPPCVKRLTNALSRRLNATYRCGTASLKSENLVKWRTFIRSPLDEETNRVQPVPRDIFASVRQTHRQAMHYDLRPAYRAVTVEVNQCTRQGMPANNKNCFCDHCRSCHIWHSVP